MPDMDVTVKLKDLEAVAGKLAVVIAGAKMAELRRREELTDSERSAVADALAQALAGPLDGYDEDSPEERSVRNAMLSALTKVSQ